MSGGVDSSAAALLLLREGFAVTGVTFALWGEDNSAAGEAGRVCAALGLPHLIWDYRADFEREVVSPFVEGYLSGGTPNPCIFCNRAVKFGRFLDDALAAGFDGIATGHYARVERREDRYALLRAADRAKDQSYVLYQLGQRELSRLLLPVGQSGLDKPALRELAAEAGLSSANRPDSQDICFIPDGDYAAFIERRAGRSGAGRFVDETGAPLGRHGGAHRFTLGQRKGLGISLGRPAFVLATRPGGDVVLTTDSSRLMAPSLEAERCVFCDGGVPSTPFEADVRIRYSHRETPALVTPLGGRRLRVDFAAPQRAPTPGQAAVFYLGEEVLGGGVIASDGEAACRGKKSP